MVAGGATAGEIVLEPGAALEIQGVFQARPFEIGDGATVTARAGSLLYRRLVTAEGELEDPDPQDTLTIDFPDDAPAFVVLDSGAALGERAYGGARSDE